MRALTSRALAWERREPESADGYRPGENPYLDARREWNERYGDYIASANAWRLTAAASLVVALLGVGGAVYIGSQNRLVPYVVAVDKLGEAVAVGRASEAGPADGRIIRAQLARWISGSRSMLVDAAAERRVIEEVYAMVNGRGAAFTALNDHFRANQPFERAKVETVEVKIQSVLPLTVDTWRVEWEEMRRSRDGRVMEAAQWQATVTVLVRPPEDDATILMNPTGLYVDVFNWAKRLEE